METTIGLAPETTTGGKPTRDMRQRAGDACLALAGTLSATPHQTILAVSRKGPGDEKTPT